ncbi:CDP-glycerol glycerophosphotransferase family protein [Priestia megaterium]|uniref:CDP-glycerol glycerophosphotransferase family protein n=1 Tax=Priestia megaterium TaxID=1404 RepID=UPI0013E37160|nr:CDP-glycerol glycerophosphotransferase family protein [Priestia megaterium]MED3865140.1 CDP-glycerol glycerophosphotransferase family protein [Priestia megaterium]MED4100489.1 CDP-glycerol glycerophosphotransferase family protein [Priestia megaterium]MED4144460.1 CDP-glycerol glycerophosphotransferase family protein [Priestia megaterium]MED4165759.1 CDP-glycerol glycerophosphotransferase family protein [Priestia megaterium]MED4200513.1 CDP-glycerol glycerophosphotransferase family protein [
MKKSVLVHSMNMKNMLPFIEYYERNALNNSVRLVLIESNNQKKIVTKLKKLYYTHFKTCDGIISDYPTRLLERRSKISIAMGHGTAIKKFPSDEELKNEYALKLFQAVKSADYFLTTSERQNELEFRNPVLDKDSKNQYLPLGLPKNDYYFDAAKVEQTYKLQRKQHKFSQKDFVILYAPTFRDYETSESVFDENDLQRINNLLKEQNAFMIYRPHPLGGTIDEELLVKLNLERIIPSKSLALDAYQSLCISDALISDYSSICIEYLPLNKPIISFIFDEKEYCQKRGLEFDFEDENIGPGIVVKEKDNFTSVLTSLLRGDFDNTYWTERRNRCLETHYTYPDGNSSERIWKLILKSLEE